MDDVPTRKASEPFTGDTAPAAEQSLPLTEAEAKASPAQTNNDVTIIGSVRPQPPSDVTVIGQLRSPAPMTTQVNSDQTIVQSGPARIHPSPRPASGQTHAALLEVGSFLGDRYEILQMLGEGGMGAVYKAADRELDRVVAIKVIRPALASDSDILARFKQELLLSHQVTHRNVIRIYDLSDAQGVKFITMEFIDGKNLRDILHERNKLTPEEAVDVGRQICQALEAAHSVGIIHRDLKPQNVMQDPAGRILVMDFGLAKTLGGDGMTQTGAFVGTLEYMPPEQALGKDLDQRADIYALGLILYELLAGVRPFVAESALASLILRTQGPAIPVSEIDAKIPGALGAIVTKCLERDLHKRYQSASEVLAALADWKHEPAPVHPTAVQPAAPVQPKRLLRRAPQLAIGAAAVLVLAGGGYLLRDRLWHTHPNQGSPAAPAISLAILPFRNASGDTSVDWLGSSVADMLTTDVGQSASLRTISANTVHQIFSDLRISPSTVIDPATIKRVAAFGNADQVVWGQYARFGDSIRIDATLEDLRNNRSVPFKVDVPSEKDIPGGVDRLAESIRQTLALPPDVIQALKASSFQPSSSSVDALRNYNQGVEAQRDGKSLEAQKHFEAATVADPNFAMAFARLAQTYSLLGFDTQAEDAARKAVLLSQSLPDAEKYQISAIELQVQKNFPEAIRAYENLARVLPDNSDVRAALARLYEDSGDLAKAKSYYQAILNSNAKDTEATIDLARVQLKSGDPQGSLEPLNHAYSLAVQRDNPEQKATSLHLEAVAYRMLGKPEDVMRTEREALTVWRQIGQQRGLAFSLNEMARAQAATGDAKGAMSNFTEALQIRRDIGDKRGLGDTLVDMGNLADDRGDHDGALKMYKEALGLEREIGNDSLVAACLNNIGSVYSEKGQFADALTYLQEVLQLREKAKVPQDIVEAEHNLGQALTSLGEYDQAISYYMKALELRRNMNDSRGAAIESYSMGDIFDEQARFGAALHGKEQALNTFRDLKDKTFWMAEIQSGYGQALILAGRMDDAKNSLDEALSLARELKNDGLVAQTLGFQADALLYKGNFEAARPLYEQALQAAIRSKEPERMLLAKIDLAKVAVGENKGASAVATLRTLAQQADEAGLKYASVECANYMGEAMLQAHDASHARQTLQQSLTRADRLRLQGLSVQAHFSLGRIAAQAKNANEARDHFRWVVSTIDTMKRDPGAEKLLNRSDLKAMYDEAASFLGSSKN